MRKHKNYRLYWISDSCVIIPSTMYFEWRGGSGVCLKKKKKPTNKKSQAGGRTDASPSSPLLDRSAHLFVNEWGGGVGRPQSTHDQWELLLRRGNYFPGGGRGSQRRGAQIPVQQTMRVGWFRTLGLLHLAPKVAFTAQQLGRTPGQGPS
jgi:hypothetical protein